MNKLYKSLITTSLTLGATAGAFLTVHAVTSAQPLVAAPTLHSVTITSANPTPAPSAPEDDAPTDEAQPKKAAAQLAPATDQTPASIEPTSSDSPAPQTVSYTVGQPVQAPETPAPTAPAHADISVNGF